MKRARNIVKILLAAVVILLSGMNNYVNAQNSSVLPFEDSWHKYRVAMGNTANSVTWDMTGDFVQAGLVNGQVAPATMNWVRRGTEVDAGVTYAYIEIYYTQELFDAATDNLISLVYSEWDSNIASGSCVAMRSIDIDVVGNDFYLATLADDDDCNSLSGQYKLPNFWWENNQILTGNVTGTVSLTVNMNKNQDHHISEWSFNGTVTTAGTGYIAPGSLFSALTGRTVNNLGGWTISNIVGNTFTLTVAVDAGNVNGVYTTDAVTFVANILGPPINDVTVTLQIADGEAESGVNYTVVTDDNGTGDKNQARVLWGIPSTSTVTTN